MTHRPLPLFAAALLLSGCSSPRSFHPFPTSTELDPAGRRLDVEWVEDFAFADVMIDGKPAGRFLVDTGASAVLVTPQVADAVGLARREIDRDRGGYPLAGADASSAMIQRVAPVRELRCGPVSVRDFDALEVDTTPLALALGHRVDGVLPATVFHDVLLTVDYPARRIEVSARRQPDAGAAHWLPLLPGSLPQVTLRIGDADVPMLLDTGSSQFLALPETVSMPLHGAPVATGRKQTVGEVLAVRQVRLDLALDWAGHVVPDPVVELGRERRGAAGAAFLRRFRVELDQSSGWVRFERAATEALTSPPVRGIGLGFLRGPTHWTVGYVLDGTPAADTGIAVGDQVTALDGVAVGEISRARYEQLLAQRDVLRLTVHSGASERDVEVPVTVLVP